MLEMGSKVTVTGKTSGGTILGVYPTTKTYDILYEDGSGENQVDEESVTLVVRVEDEEVASTAIKKVSSIGWNPGAFSDVTDTNVNQTPESIEEESEIISKQSDSSATANINKPLITASSKSITHPKIGQNLEVKDFKSKSYKPATITNVDQDLGSVDLRYDDGVEAKGVPISLLRDRTSTSISEKKEKKDKKRKEKVLKNEITNEIAEGNGNTTILEINKILGEFSTFEVEAALSMIKTIAAVSKASKSLTK